MMAEGIKRAIAAALETKLTRIPQVGEIWIEMDKRTMRQVEVVAIEGHYVRIRRAGRITRAALHRFNGKSGGYEFYAVAQ